MPSGRSENHSKISDKKTVQSALKILAAPPGKNRLTRLLPFLGPAFIASVAYVDPGNFATNIQGGAQFGYMLIWVIVVSNLMAMLIQTLSAKLGLVTGKNLAEHCREQFPRPVVLVMWGLMELVAIATDLAEFLGAALGFNLLLGVPLLLDDYFGRTIFLQPIILPVKISIEVSEAAISENGGTNIQLRHLVAVTQDRKIRRI